MRNVTTKPSRKAFASTASRARKPGAPASRRVAPRRQQPKRQPQRNKGSARKTSPARRATPQRKSTARKPTASPSVTAPVVAPLVSPSTTVATASGAEWDILLKAIEQGDLGTVKSLVPSKVPAMGATLGGRSLISIAEYHNQQTIIDYLQSLGCAPSITRTGEIRFYNRGEPYYEFTNFYESPITLDGKVWPTTEHYFQAQKFPGRPDIQEAIRTATSARAVFDLANSQTGTYKGLIRADWIAVSNNTMRKALRAKFTQHAGLKKLLLGTGTSELVEASDKDAYWGDPSRSVRGGLKGQNMLGVVLMELRTELRKGT